VSCCLQPGADVGLKVQVSCRHAAALRAPCMQHATALSAGPLQPTGKEELLWFGLGREFQRLFLFFCFPVLFFPFPKLFLDHLKTLFLDFINTFIYMIFLE
jgi:hypothetical protein